MELTKQDKAVLKVLVGKEMEHLKKDFKQLVISNSPFLNKVAGDQSDLAFLKSEAEYHKYLQTLVRKLV